MLTGHHWPVHDISRTPSGCLRTLQIRGHHPPNCPLRLQNLLPDVRMHELQGRLSLAHSQCSFVQARVFPRVQHARCNPSYILSARLWLTAVSLCRPLASPCFYCGYPLAAFYLEWSSLAACALRGLLLPVGKC